MNSNRNGNFRMQRTRAGGDRRGNAGQPNQRHRQRTGNHGNHGSSPANAQRNYERYLALAREAALNGDTVEMENCYQHAEHYFRVMKERTV
jgi:hypothetical protein